MRTLYQTAYNVHRSADGTPMAEVVLHSHEGRVASTGELRNMVDLRFVADASVLKAVIGTLESLHARLERMALDEPLDEGEES